MAEVLTDSESPGRHCYGSIDFLRGMGEMLMRDGGGMCESDEKLELGELGCCDALQLQGRHRT